MDGDATRPEDLVEHGEFLRALAQGLVGDRHLAEDVVQEARLAALHEPARSIRASRSWLARVVGNLARNTHRRNTGRRVREEKAARPEAVPSHAAVGERLAVQRRVLREKLDDECGGRGAWLPLPVPGIRAGLVPTGVVTSIGFLGGTIVAKKLLVAAAAALIVLVA